MEPDEKQRVVFDDDHYVVASNSYQKESSKITKFVMDNFSYFIKDEKQANTFLAVFIVIMIISSVIILNLNVSGGSDVSHDPNFIYYSK